jgi:thiol-disulfide isomerase/thioredoxin
MNTNWIPLVLVSLIATPVAIGFQDDTPIEKPQPDDKKPKTLKVGSTVPADLMLMSIDGDPVTFKSLRDKVVILHFWSDRCPAERHADPIFKQMDERYADNKDVVLVGIASNQRELGEKPGKSEKYDDFYKGLRKKRKSVGWTHDLLADHGNTVSKLFAAKSTPHCFVIDKKGVIQYSGALDDDPRGKKGKDATNYCDAATASILKGEPIKVSSTKPYG